MAFPLPAQAHRRVLEQICRARLLIDEEGVLSDLHVNPINGNIEPGGQLYPTEQSLFVRPSGTPRRRFDAGLSDSNLNAAAGTFQCDLNQNLMIASNMVSSPRVLDRNSREAFICVSRRSAIDRPSPDPGERSSPRTKRSRNCLSSVGV